MTLRGYFFVLISIKSFMHCINSNYDVNYEKNGSFFNTLKNVFSLKINHYELECARLLSTVLLLR